MQLEQTIDDSAVSPRTHALLVGQS